MHERPPQKNNHEKTPAAAMTEAEMDTAIELSAAREFILDSAPEQWESMIDPDLLVSERKTFLRFDLQELLTYCKKTDIWDDPTKAKALVEVISSKIAAPIAELGTDSPWSDEDDHAA